VTRYCPSRTDVSQFFLFLLSAENPSTLLMIKKMFNMLAILALAADKPFCWGQISPI